MILLYYYEKHPSYRLETNLKTGAILDSNKFSNIGVPGGSRTPATAVGEKGVVSMGREW